MKAKQVYDSIDQSKATNDVNAFLEKVKAATKNFTIENESVDKKMNELYEKIKATKPEILKGSKEPKTTNAKKKVGGKKKKVAKKTAAPSTGLKKPTVSSVASQIRKPNESWSDALSRAKVIFNEKKQTELAKTKKAVDELRDFLKNDKDFKGWPRTYGKEKASENSLERDSQRMATAPGKRVSKTGRVYWENRDNRSDREASDFPRKIFLKEGGNIYNTRNLFELGGDIMVEPNILVDNPDYLVGTETMYEMFADGGGVSKEDFVSKSIVYDNGGESLDRYTVYTPDGSVYGMSETGSGFNQYLGEADEIPKGKHLGKKLKSVPKEIESAILNRMEFEKGGIMAKGGPISEDISECKKLVSAFCKEFGEKFGLDEEKVLKDVKFQDYLGHGASVFIFLSITSNVTDLKVGETKPRNGYIKISSDINPNGITGKDDIARTYDIDIEFKGDKRYTQRTIEEGRYFKSYEYGRTIDDVMDLTDTKIFYNLIPLEKKDDLKFKMSGIMAEGGITKGGKVHKSEKV